MPIDGVPAPVGSSVPHADLPRRPTIDSVCGAPANDAVTTIGSPAYRSGSSRGYTSAPTGQVSARSVSAGRSSFSNSAVMRSRTSRTSPMNVEVPRPNCAALRMNHALGAGPIAIV